MKNRIALFAGLIMIAGSIAATLPVLSQEDESLWKGNAGPYQVQWSNGDIQAFEKNQPDVSVFSEKAYVNKRFQDELKEYLNDEEAEFTSWGWQAGILSLVPPYLSVERDQYYESYPSAHPGMLHEFQAIDLSKSGQPAVLTDIFPDAAVLQALLNDPIINPLRKKMPDFKTTYELVDYMSSNAIEIRAKGGDRQDCDTYYMPSDFLSKFAFHHVDKNKVAVRLSLHYMYEVCRGNYTQLGLMLPIPPKLKPAFELANTHKQGFLMKDANKIFFEKSTTISCGYVNSKAYEKAQTDAEFKQMIPTHGTSQLTTPQCWPDKNSN